MTGDHVATELRLAALEAELADLREAMAATRAPIPDSTTAPTATPPTDAPVSRRHALRTAGAVAAGAMASGVAASLITATPAAAAPIGPATGNPALEATAEPTTGTAVRANSTAGTALDGQTNTGTGVIGNAASGIGVSGISSSGVAIAANSSTGTAITATSASAIAASAHGGTYGLKSQGEVAAMLLFPANDAPPTRTTTQHATGSLTVDQFGVLWYCVAGGTPGTWRKVAASTTAGAYHAITPVRVYDSRAQWPFPGRISTGQRRNVSMADSRDQNGSIVTHDVVPAGASAVFANVTVTDTAFSGWLAVNPGGTTAVSASSVNWSADGQILANGLALAVNASTRNVTVIAGGPGSTDFVIDVLGYWR